jgi:hypothetical protein
MADMKEFEIFSDVNNTVVARHTERSFPGILIQGDTLKTFLDDITELREGAAAGDMESVGEVSDILQGKFVELLAQYEKVLEEHGQELPYFGSVRLSKKS